MRRAVKLTETDELSAIREYDVLAFIESFSKTCEKAPPEYSNEYFPALLSKGRTDGEYTWLSYLKKVKNPFFTFSYFLSHAFIILFPKYIFTLPRLLPIIPAKPSDITLQNGSPPFSASILIYFFSGTLHGFLCCSSVPRIFRTTASTGIFSSKNSCAERILASFMNRFTVILSKQALAHAIKLMPT